MFNYFRSMFSRDHMLDTTNRQDYLKKEEQTKAIEPVVNKEISIAEKTLSPNDKYVHEIQALFNEYGKVSRGETLEVDLHHMLTLIPRTRKKADAYKGLRTELAKQYGITLTIKSNKKR